jgi:salicylate hydroxylase/6-hydroxynicotinate 3-monooxygenase
MVGYEDRHIVIYYVKPDRSEIYRHQPARAGIPHESWSAKGDVRGAQGIRRLRSPGRAGAGRVPGRAQMGHRRPGSLDRWAEGKVTLLGDACHLMTPWHGARCGDGH